MTWNWQQPDWPEFIWDAERLARAEEAFLLGAGIVLGTVEHLGSEQADGLIVETFTDEALTTSAIEGELLDRDSVQSSIRRQLGLATDQRRVHPAEQGIAELMVTLYRTSPDPLDDGTLCEWHRMITSGRRDLRDVGRYRTHAEPMQVVSGKVWDPIVHFEAPPSDVVQKEMSRFVDWFNRTAPTGTHPLPAVTRAGITHLHFVSVHPFEDGNGRIGRAISEKALAQGVGGSALTALAATILRRRNEYYDALERANKANEITEWLAWFAGVTLEAQQRIRAQVEFTLEKTILFDRLRGELNERQEKALLRVMREGPDGFTGGLSAGNYISITKTSPATATRDLADLVEKGALARTGERKSARYHLATDVRPVPRVEITESGEIRESSPSSD